MAERVCPIWVGYLLANPFRKLLESPDKILSPYVREGMTVLEPGCAMGFFTLPLARMVGPAGRVVAIDLQEKMLARLERRAKRAGLEERVETRLCNKHSLGIDDLEGRVDFAAAIHLVHEVPDKGLFFKELWQSLKPGSSLLMIEPRGHVSATQLDKTSAQAEEAGFVLEEELLNLGGRGAVFSRKT
jgi:ubiquinone/menaquinone biosynthesis C-methylase UbiE